MDNSTKPNSAALKNGIAWTTVSSLVTALAQWVQLLILARWLAPADFGLAALALTAFGFVAPLTDLGLSKILVQKASLRSAEVASFYWLNWLACLGFFLSFLMLAWPISQFFQEEKLALLFVGTAVSFLIIPLGGWHNSLLIKHLDFENSAKVEIFSTAFSLAVSLAAAGLGWGAWSLILGFLAKNIGTSLLAIWLGRQLAPLFPPFILSKKEMGENARFGLLEAASRMVTALSLNVDKWIIGALLGPAELGIYSLAWNIALAPYAKINPIITKITWPLFARLQADDSALDRFYQKTQRLIGLLNVPIYALLAAVSSLVLPLLFGEKWAAGGPILLFLSLFACWRSLGTVGYNVLLARERADIALRWNLFYSIFMAIFLVTWLNFWPTAKSAAVSQLVGSLAIGWVWHFCIARFGRVEILAQLRLAGKLLILGFVIVGAAFIAGLIFEKTGLFFYKNNWLKLSLQLILGGAACLSWLWKTGDLAELKSVFLKEKNQALDSTF